MTFVYCDAGLANEQGHFASLCRATTAYLRQRGDHVLVLAHRRIEPGLAAELGATPFFRFHPNASVCDDPLCGPFTDFVQGARITAEDCAQLSGCTPETVVFYEHAKAAQLMGLIDWAQTRFTPEDCPLIVVTFGWPGGLERTTRGQPGEDANQTFAIRDQRMVFYRHASRMLGPSHAGRFVFAAYAPEVAAAYQALLDRPVRIFPAPIAAVRPLRDRAQAAVPTIAFLGEQRDEKGFPEVPEIVRSLLAGHGGIRVLVHNSWDGAPEQTAALRQLADGDPRLEVIARAVTAEEWAGLLDRADLIVLPYREFVYGTALSAVAVEGLANGIPLVVPRGTTMERLLVAHGMPGVVAASSAAADIVAAVGELVAEFPESARRAATASRSWAETAGPAGLVRGILSCRGSGLSQP